MTCVAGWVDDAGITFSADSAGVAEGGALTPRQDEKIFFNGDFLIGFSGSFRLGQIARYHFHPPSYTRSDRTYDIAYMVRHFVPALREALSVHGFDTSGQGDEWAMLVGVSQQIYRIDHDFQVGQSTFQFDAIGAGDQIALGAMLMQLGTESGRDTTRLAIFAAETFSQHVRGPIRTLTLNK